MKEIVQKANDFVIAYELQNAKELYENKEVAEHRAKTCGCPNCKKEAISAGDAFKDEAMRLYPEDGPVDHEELFIKRNKI
jgi:hypothetical protein